MITVVLPAFNASRTSIHVISSSQTVFGVGMGFAVSRQLYGFAAQRPPPRSRVGSAGGCAGGFCAAATDAERTMAVKAIAVFIIVSPVGAAWLPAQIVVVFVDREPAATVMKAARPEPDGHRSWPVFTRHCSCS